MRRLPGPVLNEGIVIPCKTKPNMNKKTVALLVCLSIRAVFAGDELEKDFNHTPAADASITVAAYYYPGTHPDPRWDKNKYPGFTEWDEIKAAKPRFPGHVQPKPPVWGYQNEAKPEVMAQKIDAAADYGVNAFIFDWYYYNDGPYLEAMRWTKVFSTRPTMPG